MSSLSLGFLQDLISYKMKTREDTIRFRHQYSVDHFFEFLLRLTICLICIETVTSTKPPGETSPDIEMNIGSSTSITCRITQGNSTAIWFYEEETGNKIIQPNEDIIIIDELTAKLTIRNASEQMRRYQCMVGDNAIGITKVYVGTPPTEVTDFSCIGYDLIYMTCTFTKPRNMINTKYELFLKANLDDYSNRCTLQITDDITYTYNITSTILISRETYYFNLTGTNSLGSRTQYFTINKYDSVVPAKLDVKITNVTSSSVSLFWQIPKFIFYANYGLEYEIILKPSGFESYFVNDFNGCNSAKCSVKITNLKYAYRKYTVSVRLKLRPALHDNKMWSKAYTGTFTTQPRRPDNPPKTTVGSFSIDSIETHIRLYWQQLAEYEENGPDFYYIIYEVNNEGNIINVKNSTKTSVTFAWNNARDYNYEIKSCNRFGQSDTASKIRVRPKREVNFGHTIATVYHNRTYTLAWKSPIDQSNLTNYTVFWCLSKMESPNQCRGSINFKYLNKHETTFTTEPQDHTLNLAISANFIDGYTGMQWARCSADISSDLMKLEPEEKTITSDSICVRWSSESICPSILQGYNLSYCEVSREIAGSNDHSEINCSTPKTTVVILRGKMNDKEYVIRALKPFTMYFIEMLMFSETKVGPMSDPLYVTTSEAAPSEPRNLQFNATSITSNSVMIYWQPPIQANGILKYYTVWKIKNKTKEHKDSHKVFINATVDKHSEDNFVSFKMESLNSYSNYEVYVTAHTSERSEKSNSIHFKTLIGIPTNPRNVSLSDEGDYGIIQWDTPEMPSGRIEYYEVALVTMEQQRTITVKDRYCKFKLPSCIDYYLKVRAVNVAGKHEIDHDTFPSVKPRESRLRRSPHSRAEIGAVSGIMQQSYDNVLTSLNSSPHRNENTRFIFENPSIKTKQFTVITSNESAILNSLAIPNSDFKCLDAEEVDATLFVQSKDFATLPSTWARTPNIYMRCSEYPLSNVVKIALLMFMLACLLASVSYWLRKKYNKMKNIEAVLPEELTDHMPNNYGNSEKDMHFNVSHSNDCLVNQKESYHVLTTICKGSTNGISSLAQTNTENLINVEFKFNTSTPTPLSYYCNEKTYSEDADEDNNKIKAIPENPIASKQMNPFLTEKQDNPQNQCSGYINPVNFVSRRLFDPSLGAAETIGNNVNLPLSINGYVHPSSLNVVSSQGIASNDYCTVDDSKAIGESTDMRSNSKEPNRNIVSNGVSQSHRRNSNINNGNNNNLICGYVTQRQLAEFGQLLH